MTEITRTQFALAAVLVVVVVLVGGRALSSAAGDSPSASTPLPASTTDSHAAASAAPSEPALPHASALYVHVAGRVKHPGLYRLPAGARIADAVRRAGGRAHRADLDAVNLAAKLHDGDQVLVPARAPGGVAVAAGPSAAGSAAAPAIVSLNSASEEQLETIDGVGPATAAKIMAFRQEHGGFRTVDDLAQIAGIGPKKLEAMRPHVRV